MANPQSLNKYQYTYNNPINLTDPDGHCPPCLAAAAAAAVVILLSPDTTHAPTGNETKPLARSGDDIQRVVTVGMASGPLVRTLASVEAIRSGAANEIKVRQAPINLLKTKEAQASGVTSGSGGAAIARTGERFTALSGESKLHPVVQRIYNSVPRNLPEKFHSKCCEGNNTTQMINAESIHEGLLTLLLEFGSPGIRPTAPSYRHAPRVLIYSKVLTGYLNDQVQ